SPATRLRAAAGIRMSVQIHSYVIERHARICAHTLTSEMHCKKTVPLPQVSSYANLTCTEKQLSYLIATARVSRCSEINVRRYGPIAAGESKPAVLAAA